MARHTGGWFKTWRDAWSKDLSDNMTLWAVWNAFLHMATWKESKIIWNGQQRTLPPGSVVFGVSELAHKWKCSKSTIWRWVQYLASSERIRYESGTAGCLVTILNWERYQAQVEAAETIVEQEANTDRTRTEHGENLRKKVEGKNVSVTPEFISKTWETWLDTLGAFGFRNLPNKTLQDEYNLAKAIEARGVEYVDRALYGARFEEKTDNFDPKKSASLHRILFGKNKHGAPFIEKLHNAGLLNAFQEDRFADEDAAC